jgi:hypothetical protein
MIRDEIKSLPTGPKQLRNFGLLVGGIFLALGFWRPFFFYVGAPLFLLGLLRPSILRRPYLIWMTVGIGLGFLVSTILLTLFYFLVITPIGLIARAAGKDFMNRKIEKEAMTYWSPRGAAGRAQSHENQY